jgi:hypothetical protein
LLAVENRMLLDNNAADSDDWYNKDNGGSTLNIPRVNLMKAIAKEITETKSTKVLNVLILKSKTYQQLDYKLENLLMIRNI